ncbi:CASP-like protein 1E1 [Curcuma longa]|uniref:CASP-like protein 1E1 n=1 Tax=Curcuma longa TaxID=136217 RepID=UPI003D9FA1C1
MEESQFRPAGFDVAQGAPPAAQPYSSGPPTTPPSSVFLLPNILRVVAIVLTFISAVVMGAARQTTTVTVVIGGDFTVLSSHTKSTYSAAYVYFVVVNALVFVYSVISLGLTLMSHKAGGVPSSMSLPFSVADLAAVVLLFSGNGAAAAISVVAEQGQQRLAGWGKICDAFGGFCARVNAAIVLSMFAAVAYVVLVVLAMATARKL